MALLAFGILLILLGASLGIAPAGALAPAVGMIGWSTLAIGAILAVVHLAVGPRRRSGPSA